MAFIKSGTCFAKEIREWLEPRNPVHVIAFFQFTKTGRWPQEFIPSHVWFAAGWAEGLWRRIHEYPIDPKAGAFMQEYERVLKVVQDVTFPGYEFVVETFGTTHFTIHVRYNEPDVMTGVVEEQNGRLWPFPKGQTEGQIVQTCFKALLTSFEHRARENFLWKDKPVLQPHLDIQAVWEMMPATERHVTQIF
jgi:hypothetical protein